MRYLPLFLALAACSGGEAAPASGTSESAAPATAPAAPTPAPAAEVGPDGPTDLAVPAIAAGDPVKGKAVFDAKGCGGCHAFGSVLVGPDFVGLAGRRSDAWIAKMILHPDAMTKQDPEAKKLLGKHMVQMPNQGVSEAELSDLIAYIKSDGK